MLAMLAAKLRDQKALIARLVDVSSDRNDVACTALALHCA
jgi:hypothetical protein